MSTNFEQVPLEQIQRRIAEGKITKESFSDIKALEPDLPPENFKYPEWQKPLQEAFLALDKEQLQQRIVVAEHAVHSRLQNVSGKAAHAAERQALVDALSSLRVLKQDDLLSA